MLKMAIFTIINQPLNLERRDFNPPVKNNAFVHFLTNIMYIIRKPIKESFFVIPSFYCVQKY